MNRIKSIKRKIGYYVCYLKRKKVGLTLFNMCQLSCDEYCSKCPYRWTREKMRERGVIDE